MLAQISLLTNASEGSSSLAGLTSVPSGVSLAVSFLNPGFLPFLALGAIPIIIYLINRQRYRRVEWAAMDFLLRAMRKNRKRIRLENLLLLIIRTLLILIFVLGMARPVLDDTLLPDLARANQRSEIYVIDVSYSMGFQEGGRDLLESAVAAIRLRRENVLAPGDQVGVFLAGDFPKALLDRAQIISDGDFDPLDALSGAELSYNSLNVGATLQEVNSWIRREADQGNSAAWRVHFFTDVQSNDWVTEEGAAQTVIVDEVTKLTQNNARLIVHPLGPVTPRNATLSQLTPLTPLVAVDMPTQVLATVSNFGKTTLEGLEVELLVNDVTRSVKTIKLDPGASEQVNFPLILRESGAVRLTARLRSDDLDQDNWRYRVLNVRPGVEVLVVDGGEETDWLEAALDSPSSAVAGIRLTPWNVSTVPAARMEVELREKRSKVGGSGQAEVMLLANVSSFTEAQNEEIESYLAGGGGVLVFLGGRVDSENYNRVAHRGGEGWFPMLLETVEFDESREENYFPTVVTKDHPAVAYLAQDPDVGLDLVRVHGYWRLGELAEERVLMRLSDQEKTPFVIEKPVGAGRVIVVNTGADRDWSNFPISPAYVPFLYETLPYLSTSEASDNLSVDQPYYRVLNRLLAELTLVPPAGGGGKARLVPERDDQANRSYLSVPGQRYPGLYRLVLGSEGPSGVSADDLWFSVNANPREGNLTRVVEAELTALYPGLQITERSEDVVAEALDAPSGGELWRSILFAVLGLILVESLLARSFGAKVSKSRVKA